MCCGVYVADGDVAVAGDGVVINGAGLAVGVGVTD